MHLFINCTFFRKEHLIKNVKMNVSLWDLQQLFWAYFWLYNALACCVTTNHSHVVRVCSIVASWEVSAIGHPVVLPLSVCEELLEVMEESNSTLPASMRCMRSYEVRH